jgi:hypothetical protein
MDAKIQSHQEPHRLAGALNTYKGLEQKMRHEKPGLDELAPTLKRAKRTFNKATASSRIRECDPRDIPDCLKILGTPRPEGLSIQGRENLDDFFLLFQEERPNMDPFLIFGSLTGLFLSFLSLFLDESFRHKVAAPRKALFCRWYLHLLSKAI